MKNKLGRPHLPKTRAKTILIAARFSPREARLISAAAARARQTKSQFLRYVLLAVAAPDYPAKKSSTPPHKAA